jgi:TPR repeat protein
MKEQSINPTNQKRTLWWGGIAALLLLGTLGCPYIRVPIMARLGHVGSMEELGNAWSSFSGEGLTTGSNWERATYWYEIAASKGDGAADYNLFQMYQVSGKPDDIRHYLERGASNGSPECAAELSKAYWLGLYGIIPDKRLMNLWTQKAKEYDQKRGHIYIN